MLLFLGVFLLGLVYVGQSNRVATDGLSFRKLEAKIAELKAENQSLELRAAELRSLDTVSQVSPSLNLLAEARIEYLPTVPDSVARAE